MNEHSDVPDEHPRRPRVAVVFGGRSSEHTISCVTAGSVLAAIDPNAYEVIPIGIATDGRWVWESGDVERLQITDPEALPQVDATRPGVTLSQGAQGTSLVVSEPGSPPRVLGDVDVVFPLLHGPWGEDGTLQGLLEMAGVRYVGAGVLTSAVCMDKAFMKVALAAADIPVMPSETVTRAEWLRDPERVAERAASIGYPLFVKPARGGSSIGISKVHHAGELAEAIEEAQRWDPKVLVEAFAAGAREIECGVIGNPDGAPEVSLPAEIRIGGDHEFYDFAAKYLPEEHTRLDVPAVLEPATVKAMQDLAARAFTATDGEGLARVDFFVFPDGSLVVNEVNTMPGFTPTSMFPRMWAATGLPYPALVDRLIRLALDRDTGLR
ncbi:D-alanine--D-alanine ligase family protein [Nocardioides limicola]|uniref:D-alanine--D-alanine ligase family protein n=1 Tax=Nocardioides limicola TaxID=2803368 RepID=UPI00193B0735|nr:D-alanine--D-alanine ligase family protein [Nocardioides sp. DJM-14]